MEKRCEAKVWVFHCQTELEVDVKQSMSGNFFSPISTFHIHLLSTHSIIILKEAIGCNERSKENEDKNVGKSITPVSILGNYKEKSNLNTPSPPTHTKQEKRNNMK